jgi:hypothetical protein
MTLGERLSEYVRAPPTAEEIKAAIAEALDA